MATAKKTVKADTAPAKEETTKKKRVPKEKSTENYAHLNLTVDGDVTTRTRVMHIRGFGVQIETTVSHKGIPVSVATNFVQGLKPKSKKEAKFLVIDKGPKPKKDKKAKKA
jgi:hypothetical protein